MRSVVASGILAVVIVSPLGMWAQNSQTWDSRFRAIPDPKNIGEYLRRLSAHPHHVGSAYDKDNAEWILARLREWGWDTRIETYAMLFPTPTYIGLAMIAPPSFNASPP